MRKEWTFYIKGQAIRVTNAWLSGMKLYVNGELKDDDTTWLAFGKTALLSANLGQLGHIEVIPTSALFSVEIDVYLSSTLEEGMNKRQDTRRIFSSHKRLSLTEQRLAR